MDLFMALGSYLWHLLINLSTNSHVERVQLTVGPNYFINKSDLLINNLDLKSYLLHPNRAQFNPNSANNVHLGYSIAESQKSQHLPNALNQTQP